MLCASATAGGDMLTGWPQGKEKNSTRPGRCCSQVNFRSRDFVFQGFEILRATINMGGRLASVCETVFA